MHRTFSSVGCTKYTAGTSGSASLEIPGFSHKAKDQSGGQPNGVKEEVEGHAELPQVLHTQQGGQDVLRFRPWGVVQAKGKEIEVTWP